MQAIVKGRYYANLRKFHITSCQQRNFPKKKFYRKLFIGLCSYQLLRLARWNFNHELCQPERFTVRFAVRDRSD